MKASRASAASTFADTDTVSVPAAAAAAAAAAARRLGQLRHHITHNDPHARTPPSAAPAAAESTKLLSTQQVKDFIVNGFLELDVPELPQGFNESFYQTAKHLRDASRDMLWAELTPNVNALLASPTCHGAVQSLLGTDYFMAPGNSHMHVSHAGDQGFHKDGTDHGPTQGTVRDHRPRHLLVMYYPQDTTLDMGPTTVIPQSHYPALNREGSHTSEQHLSLPHSDGGGGGDEPLPPSIEGPADRQRMADARALLGDDSVAEKKLVARAGTLVLCHLDLFHRGSRALVETAPWRPMFAIRNLVRCSDPSSPTWDAGDEHEPIEGAFAYTHESASKQKLWEEMYRYMRGGAQGVLDEVSDVAATVKSGVNLGSNPDGGGDGGDVEDNLEVLVPVVAEQISTIQRSDCEAERLGVAYSIGSSGDANAVGQLAKLLRDPRHEHIRRAASYGLTVGGSCAVAPMLQLLADPAPLGAEELQQQAARQWMGPDMSQHCKVQALHVLGQLTVQAAAACSVAVVDAIAATVTSAAEEIGGFGVRAGITDAEIAELDERLGGNNYVPEILNYMYVVERRRTIAAGCEALGQVGHASVVHGSGDAEMVLARCAETVCQWICSPEPGVAFPAFMTRNTVQHNAGVALIRLCSQPTMVRGAVPKLHGARDAGGGELMPSDEFGTEVLQGMVAEAIDRLHAQLRAHGAPMKPQRRLLGLLEATAWPWDLPRELPFLLL